MNNNNFDNQIVYLTEKEIAEQKLKVNQLETFLYISQFMESPYKSKNLFEKSPELMNVPVTKKDTWQTYIDKVLSYRNSHKKG